LETAPTESRRTLDPAAPGWTPLLDALPLGVVLVDHAGVCVEANPAASRILGVDRHLLLSRPVAGILDGTGILEWPVPDGASRWLSVSTEPGAGGGTLVALQDITEARAQKASLERMTRLYSALSQVNQAIVWSPTREGLLSRICEVMVDFGAFTMAWIGWDDPLTREVAVVGSHGDTTGYLEGLVVRSDDTPLGNGGTGTAVRTGRTCVINDFLGSARSGPWHDAALRAGFKAYAAFPIRLGGVVRGALTVYAPERDLFGAHEVALMEEAAGDISFALDHLELEERRLEAEASLRDSRARLQRAESVAAFGNWELNLADGFMRASRGAHLIYGLEGDDMSLAEVQARVLPGCRPLLDAALRDLVERGVPYNVEFVIRRACDGEERAVHSLAEYDPVKRTVFGVLHDITDRKRAERENAQLHAQLLQSQKMESLGLLAGGVAHDMNNVLGAVLALASAHLTLEPEGSPAWKAFGTIREAATRGGKLVKSLLNFARKSPAERRALDLNALLQEEARLLERTTLAKVRLELDLAPDLRTVHGDGGALAHAVMNLCVNAVDAMAEGGTLALRTRNVGEDLAEVQVEDSGCGMAPEVLERALDPFFTTKGVGKGTGLGLSLVYSTVKAHHGKLDIASEPGRGTRISLLLPAVRREEPGQAPPAPGPAQAGRALAVLVVDDDELVLTSTRLLLQVLGHTVATATCGEDALILLEQGLKADLVILDMNMPGMGGRGTLPRLRALRPAVPVLIATGRADQEVLDLAADLPGVSLLAKPFSLLDLQEHIRAIG